MRVRFLDLADGDLEEGFDYYEGQRAGLGHAFLGEFRRAVDLIVRHPHAWQLMDPPTHRRCRLHRFPYGIIYRVDDVAGDALIVAVEHLQRKPERWRRRLS